MNGYFEACKTFDEAKKLYRKLMKENHPDHGGSTETAKQINEEYQAFITAFAGENFDNSKREYSAEDVFRFSKILMQASRLNCTLEVVGTWIWAYESYLVRVELKNLGFFFSRKHKAWFYNGLPKKTRYASKQSLDDIRREYGSKIVKERKEYVKIALGEVAMREYHLYDSDCNGEAYQFAEWLKVNHPDIDVIFHADGNGVNGTYFVDGLPEQNNFWDEYCNS